MFSKELLLKTGANFFNYHAIELLELVGLRDPSEDEIFRVEEMLNEICTRLPRAIPD